MKAKTFFWAVLAAVVGVLAALCLVLAVFDPFFVLHSLDEDDTALFSNQRYEMAGLIRNQDYSAVVMGTSLVANYRASWFTQGLGEQTLKITYPDGWLSEFDTALKLAYQTHPELDTVYFGLDLNILIRPDSQRDVELPMYLYNTDPFDDVQYFLNKETYIQVAKLLVNRLNGGTTTLDEAYVWDGSHEFSREHSLAVYYRQPDVSPMEPEDTYLAAARENLAVVIGWAQAHPDTQFHIWSAPYSILYWDNVQRLGRTDAYLAALELAWQELTQYDNITVHSFLARADIVADLDNYTDYIHCSGAVTYLEAQTMMAGGEVVDRDNYLQKLDELREFVVNYDYDALFA